MAADLQLYQNGWSYDPQQGQYINSNNGAKMSEADYQTLQKQQYEDAKAAQQAADMKARGLNPDGSPIRAAFDTIANEDGTLKQNYQMNLSGLDPSQWEGYQQYKQEALRKGPSAWAQIQSQQADATAMANKEAAARQAQSGMNAGIQNLATHGGVSSGARGLAARSSSRDLLMARQNAARAGDTAKLNIASTDEGNRVGQLGQLATTEQNLGQYNKTLEGKQQEFNIQNMLNEQSQKRAYNDNTYNQQMSTWAANKQAEATARSGGGGKK